MYLELPVHPCARHLPYVELCQVMPVCYLMLSVQVTDADVQRLREAIVPSPDAFLDDMQRFSCVPRNISNEDTPLVC